jgi:hypothetical protein
MAYGSSPTPGRSDPAVLTLMMEPPSPRGHALAEQDAEAERSPGVDGVDLVVELGGHRREVVVGRRHAGVVHQHVASAQLVVGAIGQAVAVLPASGVERDRDGPASGGGLDLGCGALAGVELAAGHHDIGTSRSEALGDGPADAAAAAGHHRHLAGQVEALVHVDITPLAR